MRRLLVQSLPVLCVIFGAGLGRGEDLPDRDTYAVSVLAPQSLEEPAAPPDKGGAKPDAPPPSVPPMPPRVTPIDQQALAAPTTGLLDISQSPYQTEVVMLGDQLGLPALAFGAPGNSLLPPGAIKGPILVPSIRGFKIADDQSPFPQDRVYFGFNYWDDVNAAVNRRLGVDLTSMRVYRETFGVEKTYLDGDASIGLQLPLNTLNADSNLAGVGGESTDVGDLTVIFKFALLQDHAAGNVLSAGLAVTTPTGPDNFANFPNVRSFHEATLQPFVGYRYAWGNLFVHGFTSVDVPTDANDVTMLYNDIGVGYVLRRSCAGEALVNAIVPTAELHVNTPLNHRGGFNFTDPAGTPDSVDVTLGATVALGSRSTLSVAFVTPITGPRPFDWEVLAQFNWYFGARGCGGAANTRLGGAQILGN